MSKQIIFDTEARAALKRGVDKLADRAKAMEGMTPQQRLAFRMKELRGTKKETAQPVVKRELDSNIMSQKLNNQRQ